MTKKQLLLLLLAFLLGIGLAKLAAAQSQIVGPERTQAGTLATFEITPSQDADWTVSSVETTDKIYQTDTSTNRLYFATPQPGTYHIIAAIVVEGKPQVLSKTFVNGDGDVKPTPRPPVPPRPDQPLQQWVQAQLPLLVKSANRPSESRSVATCFEQTVQKIGNGTIKTAQNARAQLQIALTMTLAMASDTAIDDWHDFLTQLSRHMATELGNKINDIDAVKTVFQTVAESLTNLKLGVESVELKEKQHEPEVRQNKTSIQCEKCNTTLSSTPNSTRQTPNFQYQTPNLRTFRLFR